MLPVSTDERTIHLDSGRYLYPMPTSIDNKPHLSPGALISHLLRAARKELQEVALGNGSPITLNQNEVAALELDAFEVLRLVRSLRNTLAPINKVPPEVLSLVPDFWHRYDGRGQQLIALTHVCRTWREAFVSRSSLWACFDCKDADKTSVYLERSKSSLISVSLNRDRDLSPSDPFLQIIPHAIGRLKSLFIKGTRQNLQGIAAHLFLPAPLLEDLSIDGSCNFMERYNPVVATELLDGNLSSLRKLRLQFVRTELPWRDMINLTSFKLAHTSPGEVSIVHLLDFFESTPNLRKIELYAATPTSGAQTRRLVSLNRLEWLYILEGGPSFLLLDHLLIPASAKLITQVDPLDPLPRCLDGNLSNFTKICLSASEPYPSVQFSGPNGRIDVVPEIPQTNTTRFAFESLARFDTSKAKRLEIDNAKPSSRDLPYQTLLRMEGLLSFMLSRCQSPHIFIDALRPNTSSEAVVCPKLEELILVLRIHSETLKIKDVVEMAAARALRGAKLKSVRIVSSDKVVQVDASELKKYVLHVECDSEVVTPCYESDEED